MVSGLAVDVPLAEACLERDARVDRTCSGRCQVQVAGRDVGEPTERGILDVAARSAPGRRRAASRFLVTRLLKISTTEFEYRHSIDVKGGEVDATVLWTTFAP